MNHTRINFIFFILTLCFCQCKKNTDQSKDISLKDKPLNAIRSAIQGKWQLHFLIGGITGNLRQERTNSFIEFNSTDSIYWTENSTLIVADKLQWNKTRDMVGDSTWIMSFCEMRGSVCYPYSWGVQGIQNDTLILYDNTTDPFGYLLTRSKLP